MAHSTTVLCCVEQCVKEQQGGLVGDCTQMNSARKKIAILHCWAPVLEVLHLTLNVSLGKSMAHISGIQ